MLRRSDFDFDTTCVEVGFLTSVQFGQKCGFENSVQVGQNFLRNNSCHVGTDFCTVDFSSSNVLTDRESFSATVDLHSLKF